MKISVLTPTIRKNGIEITQESLSRQTFSDFEWLTDINNTGVHDLNKAYNRMLKKAKGELIVSLQDYIKVPPDYLEKFWNAYQANPNTFITAPVGKVDNLQYMPPAKWDWRANLHTESMDWKCWEIDSGCASRSALFDVGGFDEELDKWWSFDNYSVGKRADLLGYKFMNLFTNPAIAYDHDAFIKHPFREKFRPKLVELRMLSYNENPRLNYLN